MAKTGRYDAFISYRHCEPDSEIASRLQKKLEGFRLPKDIAKKVGRTKLSRIFRDDTEFAVSDDLTQAVDEALANTCNPVDFEVYLRSLGYKFVRNCKYEHPSVVAPDWQKPVRLSSLGKDYSREAILRRLQSQREDKYFVDFYTPKSYYQRQPLIVRIRDFEKRTE